MAACPPFTVLAKHIRPFADLLTTRRGTDLEDGMTAVEDSDQPALHAFVRGLLKDLDAVVAGLCLPYSNGPIEGPHQVQALESGRCACGETAPGGLAVDPGESRA